MADDVIKEFLIGLGFKIDDEKQKKFNQSIDQSTRVVQGLGKAIAVATAAVATGIVEMSDKLESLFYVSQRSNATVSNLQALEYAAGQIGVGADRATASVQNLARAIYLQPGNEGLIAGLGVQTREANGQLRDTTKIALDLVATLKKMGEPGTPGFAVAAQYAAALGIDPDSLQLMMKNLDQLNAAQERYRQRLKDAGLDADKVAAQSRDVQNAIRDLGSELEIFGALLVRDFYDPFMSVVSVLKDAVHWINSLSQETDGWSTRIAAVTAAIIGWKAAMGGLAGARAMVMGGGAAGAVGGSSALAGALVRASPWLAAGAIALTPTTANEGEDAAVAARNAAFDERNKGMFSGDTDEQRAVNYFMHKGWTREQAVGIVANLKRESSMNPNAVGDGGKAYGLAQWHPDRQKAISEMAGQDVKTMTFYEQLAAIDRELKTTERSAGYALKEATTAEEAARIVSEKYERPANRTGEANLRAEMATRLHDESLAASRNVEINQKTEITVTGTGDPKTTADIVTNAQDRVNADMLRNTKGAVR
jgi:hypothetical protein